MYKCRTVYQFIIVHSKSVHRRLFQIATFVAFGRFSPSEVNISKKRMIENLTEEESIL